MARGSYTLNIRGHTLILLYIKLKCFATVFNFLWGNFLEKVPPHPFKNFPNKIIQTDLSVPRRTVGASARLAFALASGKAPPRPYPLRELFALGIDCVRTVLPLTCHPERREPCAANEAELLRVERSRRRSSKQKREALVPKRDLRRITNNFPKAKLHPLSW